MQVFDLSKDKPDKVLKRLYENLDKGVQAGEKWAGHVKNNLRILACGGDGTVAWIVTAVKCVAHELNPVSSLVLSLRSCMDCTATGTAAPPVWPIMLHLRHPPASPQQGRQWLRLPGLHGLLLTLKVLN